MSDFWPDDIGIPDKTKSPVIILKEIASALGERTKNNVTATVKNAESRSNEMPFRYIFFIVAKALNNYQFKLFEIEFGVPLYPLTIIPDENIIAELDSQSGEFKILKIDRPIPDSYRTEEVMGIHVESDQEFLQVLNMITNSSRTRKIIRSLVSQIETLH